ncbi:MAG: hypothetical protein WCL32_23495 [Planctomycetota bacterium]
MGASHPDFKHEQELRAIYWNVSKDIEACEANTPELNGGFDIDIDVNKLIEHVFLHPTCDKWILPVVANIKDKYNIVAEVTKSPLYQAPVY